MPYAIYYTANERSIKDPANSNAEIKEKQEEKLPDSVPSFAEFCDELNILKAKSKSIQSQIKNFTTPQFEMKIKK
jgi:hypothetical protein